MGQGPLVLFPVQLQEVTVPNETRNVSAARDVAEPHETGAYSGQGPIYSDYPLIIHLKHWFFVMSSRPLYATLRRAPVREHMMHLVDVFIGYAARDSRYSDNPAHAAGTVRAEPLARKLQSLVETSTTDEPMTQEMLDLSREIGDIWKEARANRSHDILYARREPLARQLRALMETWTPPALTQEMVDLVRELLVAEGEIMPEGGWDNLPHCGPESVEDILLWPEGVPKLPGE